MQTDMDTSGARSRSRSRSAMRDRETAPRKRVCTSTVFAMRISAAERDLLTTGAKAAGVSTANYVRRLLGWPAAVMGSPRKKSAQG